MSQVSSNKLEVDLIDSVESFQSLSEEWNLLAERSPSDSVFIRHEWFDAAWQWLQKDHLMRVLCVYRNGTPISILPLTMRIRNYYGIKIRTYEAFSVPDTQLFDIIGSQADTTDSVKAITQYLVAKAREWDMIKIYKVPENSRLISNLHAELRKHGCQVSVREGGTNPYMTLEGGWDAYYSRRSRRLKKGNNNIANRLKRAFERVEISWLNSNLADDQSLKGHINEVVRISSKSWKTETATSLDNPAPRSFIERLTHHAYKMGWLSVWILYLNGQSVATEYQLIHKGKVHALRSDFDQSYNDHSPGTYLNWKLLESLFDANMKSYLMGHGNNPYKMRWAEESKLINNLLCYGTTMRARALYLIDGKIKPLIFNLWN